MVKNTLLNVGEYTEDKEEVGILENKFLLRNNITCSFSNINNVVLIILIILINLSIKCAKCELFLMNCA